NWLRTGRLQLRRDPSEISEVDEYHVHSSRLQHFIECGTALNEIQFAYSPLQRGVQFSTAESRATLGRGGVDHQVGFTRRGRTLKPHPPADSQKLVAAG